MTVSTQSTSHHFQYILCYTPSSHFTDLNQTFFNHFLTDTERN